MQEGNMKYWRHNIEPMFSAGELTIYTYAKPFRIFKSLKNLSEFYNEKMNKNTILNIIQFKQGNTVNIVKITQQYQKPSDQKRLVTSEGCMEN